ncbi:MAG: hypothetical protein QOF16_612 [Actinomycetota bacterium]|jgi:phospholipase C|nr:hypothetical protein [Actinomycetota bacterium]
MTIKLVLLTTVAALFALTAPAHAGPAEAADPPGTHPVDHVFVYVMENTSYKTVVGNKDAPYLNRLISKGALATNYFGTGHVSLDNYLAMTSGVPPNPMTTSDCFIYLTALCVQDATNIADQLEAKGYSWKGYMDSMKEPCQHPPENTQDPYQTGYATRHDPFVYYRSIVDDQARCTSHVVALPQLWKDIAAGSVPNYSFITPDTCHDGHDSGSPCKHDGGIKEANLYAHKWVPKILHSASYKNGGVIFVTFDEGGFGDDDTPGSATGGNADYGGHVYTLLLSPNVAPGTKLEQSYNHYAQLKTVEDVFCLDYLGGAASPGVASMIDALHQPRCALEHS